MLRYIKVLHMCNTTNKRDDDEKEKINKTIFPMF